MSRIESNGCIAQGYIFRQCHFELLDILIVVHLRFLSKGERVLKSLQELGGLSPNLWVGAAEHIVSVLHRAISVDSIVFLHHKDAGIHLSLFQGFVSHPCLELYRTDWVDPLYMLESGINLLFFECPLMLHELVRLVVKELISLEHLLELLTRH